MSRGDVLFRKFDLAQITRKVRTRAEKAVDGIRPQNIMDSPEKDIIDTIFARIAPAPLVLHDDRKTMKPPKEVYLDVSSDPRDAQLPGDRPRKVKATQYTVVVPFDGHADIFKVKPSQWSMSYPRGTTSGQDLVLNYVQRQPNAETLRESIGRDLAEVKEYVEWANADVEKLRSDLRSLIARRVKTRKAKLARSRDASAGR